MKPYWTKNNEMIDRAIEKDSHPVSLIALELRSLTKGMTVIESTRIARLLVNVQDY